MAEATQVRRPYRSSEEVYKSASQDIIEVMKKCEFASEVTEDEWDDLLKAIKGCINDDGYHLMRALEDDCHVEGSLADADELDAISEVLRQHHELVLKEWVKTNNITVPHAVGDTVTFKHAGTVMTGKINKIDAEMAKVTVAVEGRRGMPIVYVEDIQK